MLVPFFFFFVYLLFPCVSSWYARDVDAHQSAASAQHHEMKKTWVGGICVDVTLQLLVRLYTCQNEIIDMHQPRNPSRA